MADIILVPLDGSPLAERALPVAVALARETGARLHVIEAVEVAGLPGLDRTSDQIRALDEAEAYLALRARELAQAGSVATVSAVLGSPGRAIAEEAELHGARLIVMATHGRGSVGRWIAGSTATELLRSAPVPLLLLRAWHTHHAVERIARGALIVVPLDGSPVGEAALPVATQLATLLAGTVLLIHVVRPPDPSLTPVGMATEFRAGDIDARLASARHYLRGVAGRLPKGAFALRLATLVGEPAKAIDAVARRRGAAFVVMTTQGRTGLDRMLLGSVAEGVIQTGSVPVILVRRGMRLPGAPVETTPTAPADVRPPR